MATSEDFKRLQRFNILQALSRFIRQRPGLDFANYGDVRAYRAEARSITTDLRHAEALLSAVSWRDSIGADALIAASSGAFSGRLRIRPNDDGPGVSINYCTGQYWPTEYRAAVCSVLSSALWAYWRESMPEPVGYHVSCIGETWRRVLATSKRFTTRADAEAYAATVAASRHPAIDPVYPGNLSAGDWIRAQARRELGQGIAARWFR